MQSVVGQNEAPQVVSDQDLESLLAALSESCTHPTAGVFGPDSLSWKINRESALFLASGRAALLQLAHPWVAASLADHSTVMRDPIARFHSTFRIVFTMIFGSLHQALAAARHLHHLHGHIQGELREDVTRYPRGSHYQANEVAALRWVYATLVDSAVLAYQCAVGPLTFGECEQYYAETRTFAAFFGIPAGALPQSWAGFAAYNAEMHASSALGVTAEARAMAQSLLAGAGSRIRPPFWFRALTIAWLPVRFRNEFGLAFADREQRAAAHAQHWLPKIYSGLPSALRFTGPAQEAHARLAGRRIGPLTRGSNRFWIGEQQMPFA